MKIVSLVSVAILALPAAGFIVNPSLRAQAAEGTRGATESVVIPVKGMSCMACVGKTKQTLRAVPGVTGVDVRLSPGSATVKYDPAQVTPDKLVGVIKELGYETGSPTPPAPKTGQ